MSYQTPSRKRPSRLSTPVRLGVAAVAACFIAAPVLSNPVNPTVVNGSASFNQAGNVLTVTNSNGAIINWQQFNIANGETTHFAQTSASSTVLNRVLANDPSLIYGTLSSNGRVWLVNPAGIMVGAGGRIDVAGFVASTLNISNADFLAGRHLFINDGSAGNVINQGEIRTPAGGSVYLIGANVTNEGIITTPNGETILAAGATVSLIDSALPGVKVDITGAEGNATNLGTITAEAGRIGIAGVIVRNSGTLNASSVVSEGGRIFLKASQDAYVDGNGRIVTTGTRGGSVEVLGNRVAVMDNAEIDASGTNGGGRIMVGGDYQGKNPDIQNASITYFGPNASLKADATEVGDGGTVIVWADDTTRAYGNISSRGGANGGDGGFVETSGHRSLSITGARVDTRAPNGRTGSWLLDPTDISIVSGVYGGPLGGTFDPGTNSTITDGDVNAALVLSNLIIQTSGGTGGIGDITAESGVSVASGGGNSLTLAAYGGGGATHGNIGITGSSFIVNGGVTLLAGWDGSGFASTDVIAGRGDINISGSLIQSSGGAINLWAGKDITLSNSGNTGTWVQGFGMNVWAGGDLKLISTNNYGGDLGPTGPGVMLFSTGTQYVTAVDEIKLIAGSTTNSYGSGNSFYGGSVAIKAYGDQYISAATITLAAGTAGHDNVAAITTDGAIQDITVTSLLQLTGGAGGNDNYAWIGATGNDTVQTIHASGADIILTGGASGGALDHENSADIGLSENNVSLSRTVYAGSITINGNGNSTTYGGAGFGTHNGNNQSFYVSGDLTMNGGNSNVDDFRATAAYIGSEFGGGTINLFVGGNINLNGGSGTAGGVLIGSLDNSGASSSVNLFAGADINATANTGGVWLGVKNPTSTYVSDVKLIAGWDGNTATPDVGAGPGDITAPGASIATVGGAFTALAYGSVALGTITTDAWNSGSDGGDVYIKAFNGTLDVASISAQGAWGGGYGGAVTLWAMNDLTVGTGGINASGGGGYSSSTNGFAGGDGGAVLITSLNGTIAVNGDILSNGGQGGNGGLGGIYGNGGNGGLGGNGGNGGNITLNSGTSISLAAGKQISSIGGTGGWGGDGGEWGDAGTGGNGGGGGIISLTSGTYISLGASSQIIAKGGDGGEGGVGGYDPGNSGYQGGSGGNGGGGGSITLATAGNIDLVGNVSLDASGGIGGTGGQGGYSYNSSGYGYGGTGGGGGGGGGGGWITLTAIGSGSSILLGNAYLSAGGGTGGQGGTGGTGEGHDSDTTVYGYGGNGGQGGTGGGGGDISLSANGTGGTIQIGSAQLSASGGDGGIGGIGGIGKGYDDCCDYGYGLGGNGGQGGTGGTGGVVSLVGGSGGISMDGGQILARGGNGGIGGTGGQGYGYADGVENTQGYSGFQGLGGNGGNDSFNSGSISLNSGGIISLTNGWLDAGGGNGGGYAPFSGNGGAGGEGGSVYVQGASIVANGTAFQAHGGSGGRGDAYAGTTGGSGGNGGYVGLVATAGGISLTDAYVDAGGGHGGWGADSLYQAGWGYRGTTNGGSGGNGGYVYAYASGALGVTSSSILANGGWGGQGGNDLTGYSIGGNGGNGGNGGYMWLGGSSIAMAGSSIQAFGGWGGNGGDGFGHNAIYTVTDHWGVEICGGMSGIPCNGTQTLDSLGVPLFFHPADGSGSATVGGSGGYGGNVSGGTAISMNATAGDITMSSDSTIYASPGGGGQGGLGWYGGAVGFYYPSYPSSYVQQISWTGISHDFDDWSKRGDLGTSGSVSINATGNISLGHVEAGGGTVSVMAGGAILDNNGSAVNIVAANATLTSTYGGAPGSLAISAGTEVYGTLAATVTGGAYGGIDIANTGDDLQPTSVNLTDNATSGSAVFRQNFTSSTATLYGGGITLVAQSGGFVGLSSNRDLTFDGSGTFNVVGGGGIIGFAANNGTLNIDSALAGGTNSVELSAGTLNISAPVSGVNITLDGSTTNVNAATTATAYLDIFGGTVNVNAAMQGQDVLLGANTLNVGNLSGTGGIYAINHMLAVVTGNAKITGGYLKTTTGDLELLVGGDLNIGNASYGGHIWAGYNQSVAYFPDASIAVGGDLKLTNGAYIAAANDVYIDLLGAASTLDLSSGGGSPAYILSDIGTGVVGTTYVAFATRSSGGIIIDGHEGTETVVGGSGFFAVDTDTPATEGHGLEIDYASSTVATDLCAISPALCRGPDEDPPKPPPKPDKDKDKKTSCAEGDFGCEEDQNGQKDEKPAPKKVAQCSI